MQPQEELNVQILIKEYQEKLAEYLNENIRLKTLLKQRAQETQEREQYLQQQIDIANQAAQMEVFDGKEIQE